MKKSLFNTAALLCAVSFNALQASDCGNPYGVNQESTRQNRCIRVITEIPVEMSGFLMPRQSCGYSNAGESKTVESLLDSSTKRSAKDELLLESILQLLIALTKNLKVAPSVDDTTSLNKTLRPAEAAFGIMIETDAMLKAREAAEKSAKAADAAKVAADAAAEEAAKAKREKATDAVLKAREEAAAAAREAATRLSEVAETKMGEVDDMAANVLKAGQSPFTYKEPETDTASIEAQRSSDRHYLKLKEPAQKALLEKAALVALGPKTHSQFTTDVALAQGLLIELRGTGAPVSYPADADWAARIMTIEKYLKSNLLGISPAVRAISLAAIR